MDTQYDIVHISTVASTQDEAKARFQASRIPTLVVADRQVEGRGRQGRTWVEPDRAMYSSYAFEADWPLEQFPLIALCVAVSVAEAIDATSAEDIGLKWPNDLFLQGDKVGGILVEASGRDVVAGCGANLFWREPINGASALYSHDPGVETAERLANEWVRRFRDTLRGGYEDWPRDQYELRSVTLGETVSWETGSGRAVSIGAAGGLVVETSRGHVTIHAGDVHLHGSR